MIWRPKPDQRVILRYRKEMRSVCPHLATGKILVAASGRGPINALVQLDGGRLVVVPRGNLFKGDN
jgi:hypothetical protein